jgi:hypothetical protein
VIGAEQLGDALARLVAAVEEERAQIEQARQEAEQAQRRGESSLPMMARMRRAVSANMKISPAALERKTTRAMGRSDAVRLRPV